MSTASRAPCDAVMKNISHFCGRNKSRTRGEFGWQKIVVCVVSDGREKIHPRTLDALGPRWASHQHGIAKNYVNSKAVQAHVYEYTTQVSLDSDLKFKGAEKGIVPCQMIFCLEREEPEEAQLRTAGSSTPSEKRSTRTSASCSTSEPGRGRIRCTTLWKAFDTDSNVAGACGEIKASEGKMGRQPAQPHRRVAELRVQDVQHPRQAPGEAYSGTSLCFPALLSAYRFHALQNDETGHGPLSQYFKGETLHGQHADVFTANMYLAEDRILCWELVAKRARNGC